MIYDGYIMLKCNWKMLEQYWSTWHLCWIKDLWCHLDNPKVSLEYLKFIKVRCGALCNHVWDHVRSQFHQGFFKLCADKSLCIIGQFFQTCLEQIHDQRFRLKYVEITESFLSHFFKWPYLTYLGSLACRHLVGWSDSKNVTQLQQRSKKTCTCQWMLLLTLDVSHSIHHPKQRFNITPSMHDNTRCTL